ncbi:MAG: YfhO family protein [Clostridia bacterium]|nr:YfhO family protein [Clostridia bacterium]
MKRLKAPSLKSFGTRNNGFNTFLVAFLMAACCFVPYIITGRGYFLFYGDFNVQQIPFYQLCHDAVRNGELGWSFTTDLGANFIGSYSFYLLGSPFFWLTIPFPNSFVPYLMGPLLILKFAFAALTAYLYIKRFTKNTLTAQLGGILYAFSGFSVYNIFFNHFHEAIIFFPLLLLGFELLATENKRGVFAFTVCLCGVINYFFFFGMLVFGLIYMFFRFLTKSIRFSVKKLLAIIFEVLLGIAMAAIILIPSYLAISSFDRLSNITLGWNSLLYGKESIYTNIIEVFFFPPDLPARPVMFPNADVKWSSLGGWLPVFSMVGVFAYCQGKKGNWIKSVLITCTVMALVPILNSAFYAFNNAYYARWFYMPILLMCLGTALALEDNEIDFKKPFLQVFGITLGITLIIGLFPQTAKDGKFTIGLFTDNTKLTYIVRFWATCLIALCGLVVLGFLLKLRKETFQRFLKLSLVTVAVFSIGYANFFIAAGKTHSYSNTVMIDNLIEGDLQLEGDKDTFRVDTYKCVDNTPMFLGYSSINCFHSIVPSTVIDFYKFIDGERVVASRPETNLYAIRPLLSVKYLLNRENGEKFEEDGSTKMTGYKHLKTENGYKVYENENFIGYGFSYDSYMSYDLCEKYSGNDRAKMMLKAVLLTDEQIEKYGNFLKNIETEEYISTSDTQMAIDCEERNKTSATSFKTGKNSFTATVKRDTPNLVFFSIPYDKGWTAYVNGVKTPVEKVNVGFMAVAVDSGVSEIEFRFETPGLKLGIIITSVSALILIVYSVVFASKSKWL